MKKIIAVTMIVLSIATLAAPAYSQNMALIPAHIQTPEQLVSWFGSSFKYEMVLPDRPRSYDELMSERTGDCDDFAFLASLFFSQNQTSHQMLIIRFKGLSAAHAVCAWSNENGSFSFVSTKEIYRTNEKDVLKAVEKIYSDWDSVSVLDDNRRVISTFRRKA